MGAIPKIKKCKMNKWGNWSACSSSGMQYRARGIKPSQGPCIPKSLFTFRKCAKVDCEVSRWGNWSACKDGKKSRTRTVTKNASNGGSECPTLIDDTTCAVDCTLSGWSDWSPCSADCEGGTQIKTRTVTQEAKHGGTCAETYERRTCGTGACTKGGVAANVYHWNEKSLTENRNIGWPGVDKSHRTLSDQISPENKSGYRRVFVVPVHGTVLPDDKFKYKPDDSNSWQQLFGSLPSPFYIEWKGNVCNFRQTDSVDFAVKSHEGAQLYIGENKVVDNEGHMGYHTPIETCVEPSSEQECSEAAKAAGVLEGGAGYSFAGNFATRGCYAYTEGTYAGRAYWGTNTGGVEPSTGEGQHRVCMERGRYNSVDIPAGTCKPFLVTYYRRRSNTGIEVGVRSSGGSKKFQTLKMCTHPFEEMKRIVKENRPAGNTGGPVCIPLGKVNCKVSDWGNWSACDPDTGKKSKTRTVEQEAKNGGSECPTLTEEKPCTVDCTLSEWGDWSPCSADCEGGTQTRKRTVTQEAKNGGKCGDTIERRKCGTGACTKGGVAANVYHWNEKSLTENRNIGWPSSEPLRTLTALPDNKLKYKPNDSNSWQQLFAEENVSEKPFYIEWKGNVCNFRQTDSVDFAVKSHDGAQLYIGENKVVDNDGNHAERGLSNSVDIPAGTCKPFLVTYYRRRSDTGVEVGVRSSGGSKKFQTLKMCTHPFEEMKRIVKEKRPAGNTGGPVCIPPTPPTRLHSIADLDWNTLGETHRAALATA